MKVRVWVPFQTQIPYVVEVESPDPEKVKEALLKKDPSEWEYDPEFYEELGFNWESYVSKVNEDDIEILDSS